MATAAITLSAPSLPSLNRSLCFSYHAGLQRRLFTANTPPFPGFSGTRETLILPPPPRSAAADSNLLSALNAPTLKSRLRDGQTLYGLFLLTFSPTLAEIAGLAGYDFVVVDLEHGHGGVSDALPCLHALAAARTPAVLRLPESSAVWAKKALDLGPQGIMFPMIESPKSARNAVSYCRFPPAGVRGSAHPLVRASLYGFDAGYLSNYEEELLIMCQVESEEAVKEVKDIAAVEGVDCIQMGPLDLSASMGYLWDPGNKKVREVLRAAETAVLGTRKKAADKGGAAGAYLSGFATPSDSAEDLRARGYPMIAGAVDVGLFRSAAAEDVKKFQQDLAAAGGSGGKEDRGEDSDDERVLISISHYNCALAWQLTSTHPQQEGRLFQGIGGSG